MTTKPRSLLGSPLLWIGSASMAVAMAFGCSSSSGSPGPNDQDASSSSDGSGAADAADAGSTPDSGHPGDGGGDGGPAPDALYGCATMGSFGWPCTATTSGPDPTDCTDPNYPDCFAGGQGGWCTKSCVTSGDCAAVEDAGCAPASCNMRGYCK